MVSLYFLPPQDHGATAIEVKLLQSEARAHAASVAYQRQPKREACNARRTRQIRLAKRAARRSVVVDDGTSWSRTIPESLDPFISLADDLSLDDQRQLQFCKKTYTAACEYC
jgi:hypothetical protein